MQKRNAELRSSPAMQKLAGGMILVRAQTFTMIHYIIDIELDANVNLKHFASTRLVTFLPDQIILTL